MFKTGLLRIPKTHVNGVLRFTEDSLNRAYAMNNVPAFQRATGAKDSSKSIPSFEHYISYKKRFVRITLTVVVDRKYDVVEFNHEETMSPLTSTGALDRWYMRLELDVLIECSYGGFSADLRETFGHNRRSSIE
ncbi:hypothetical protein Tco_0151648 [Tanacetum coccineum]